jgi:microcystin-dependent protein
MFYPGTLEAGETLADKIPNGYAICDGLNGTPNLSGRFIKASTTTWGPVDNTDTEVVDNVRTNRIKLSADNLPKHTHSLSGVTIENASTNEASVSEGTAIKYATGTNEFTPINPSASSQNHTHTFGNNAVTGDGDFQNTSFNIEPQSYELIFIMKL